MRLRAACKKPFDRPKNRFDVPSVRLTKRMHCQPMLIKHAGFFMHEWFCDFCRLQRHKIVTLKIAFIFLRNRQHFILIFLELYAEFSVL